MSVLDLLRGYPPASGYFHLTTDEAAEILALEEALRMVEGKLQLLQSQLPLANVEGAELHRRYRNRQVISDALKIARAALRVGGEQT